MHSSCPALCPWPSIAARACLPRDPALVAPPSPRCLPQVPAQALEPNGTNPLGLDPLFLASAYYGSMAWESEMAEEGWDDPNSERRGAPPQLPCGLGSAQVLQYGSCCFLH